VLGGVGKTPDSLRPLSPIELTIIEFLAINILGEFNKHLENSKFSLQSVANHIRSNFGSVARGVEVILDLTLGDLSGNITLLLPLEFLSTLSKSQKSIYSEQTSKQRFKKFSRIANDLDLHILLGKTEISANDLLFLERNDVVLIENPGQMLQKKTDPKNLQLFVGNGTNVYIKGKLSVSDDLQTEDIPTAELIIEVQQIVSEKDMKSQPKREKMNTKKKPETQEITDTTSEQTSVAESIEITAPETTANDAHIIDETGDIDNFDGDDVEIDGESLASLENVLINLRVLLGGRRISLNELQKIRVGQIIELGCRPNDPVELVTDSENRPIASGELIEIEGQLGVRLTKIFV
jgi:flagellar motor switch/type III secretory pathway protein FliN